MKIVFATNNEHKLREVRQILDGRYEVLSLADIDCHADIPETADTLDGNALQKAHFVYDRYGLDVFADDTGLEVDALGGAPGVHTARYAGCAHNTDANVDKLLREMQGKSDRRARFRTAIALIKGGQEHLFEGRVEGFITSQREGEGGFGYDPVFRPEGYDGTFAQLGVEVKNTISHRARAVQKLVAFLTSMLLFLLTPCFAVAQRVGTWTAYPSYGTVSDVVALKGYTAALGNGNLWVLDNATGEILTLGTEQGLNDSGISAMVACPDLNSVVLVYGSGNIDILSLKDFSIGNISGLKNASLSNKTVNSVTVRGSEAWVCMSFGLVRIDLALRTVVDTYNLGENILSCNFTADNIYVSGETNGIRRCPLNVNMHEVGEFVSVHSTLQLAAIKPWRGGLVGLNEKTLVFIDPATDTVGTLANARFYGMCVLDDTRLLCSRTDGVYMYHATKPAQRVLPDCGVTHMDASGSHIYAACGYQGLMRYAANADGASALTATGGPYLPAGPRLNNYYKMHNVGDRLLVAQGWADYKGTWKNGSASYMENAQWHNLDTVAVGTNKDFFNVTDIAQDPADPDHHYVSSFGHGIVEYRKGRVVKVHTAANSTLSTPIQDNPAYYTRVGALAYDDYGTLWLTNCTVDSGIVWRDAQGRFGKIYHKNFDHLLEGACVVPHGDYVLVGSTVEGIGILCIFHGGNPADRKIRRMAFHGRPIVQQDGVSYDTQYLFAVAPDHDGAIWVGTDMGLFVVPSVEDFMADDFVWQQIKINRDDDSGLADYLLSGLWITAIAVDGANRKWVGTDGQGLYLLSPDGQQMLQHFTTDNSPILSDNIQSLSICPTTGQVFIGTEAGLCGYFSDASQGADNLDKDSIVVYPNPVPPGYNGPITVRGLTEGAEVKVATANGHVVFRDNSNGGVCTWNGCDGRGRRVATGVYYVISSTSDGKTAAVVPIVITK